MQTIERENIVRYAANPRGRVIFTQAPLLR